MTSEENRQISKQRQTKNAIIKQNWIVLNGTIWEYILYVYIHVPIEWYNVIH